MSPALRRFIVTAILVFSALPLFSQTTPGQTSAAPADTISVTLADALQRAKANSPLFQAAVTDLGMARENRLQARAGLLPGVSYGVGAIYTQPNGTPTGVFVSSNGVREYLSEGIGHESISPAQLADYQRTSAALVLAQARSEVAARGLKVTVVQNFYGYLAALNRATTAQQVLDEAQRFFENTQKLEHGGEIAHSDVIKAQIQMNDLQRARDQALLARQNAKLSLAVLLFPNVFQDFTLVSDLATVPTLPSEDEVRKLAENNNPELKAAYAAMEVANKEVSIAWAGYLPSLSVDILYGIDANQFAAYNRDGMHNLGYQGVATLNIPVWNWEQPRARFARLNCSAILPKYSSAPPSVPPLPTWCRSTPRLKPRVPISTC